MKQAGFKWTPFWRLPYFSFDMVPADPMHLWHLGICKMTIDTAISFMLDNNHGRELERRRAVMCAGLPSSLRISAFTTKKGAVCV